MMWAVVIGLALGGLATSSLHHIYQEVRSIRRMMNEDRRISNEVSDFD